LAPGFDEPVHICGDWSAAEQVVEKLIELLDLLATLDCGEPLDLLLDLVEREQEEAKAHEQSWQLLVGVRRVRRGVLRAHESRKLCH
jgi:hypothetical protein